MSNSKPRFNSIEFDGIKHTAVAQTVLLLAPLLFPPKCSLFTKNTQMASVSFVIEELAELLAKMDPEKVLSFRTSPKAQERLEKLLWKNKANEGLDEAEKTELEQFMLVEHIVSVAKARALKYISAAAY
jgi:hypothetical protein